MIALGRAVLWIAIVVFAAIGLSGMLFGAWEFGAIVPVALDDLGPHAVTLKNQLRFLKALELSAAVFLFVVRRDAFRIPAVNRAVLVMLSAAPAARLVSLVIDGLPTPEFLAIMGLELCGAVIVALASYQAFAGARRASAPTPGATVATPQSAVS